MAQLKLSPQANASNPPLSSCEINSAVVTAETVVKPVFVIDEKPEFVHKPLFLTAEYEVLVEKPLYVVDTKEETVTKPVFVVDEETIFVTKPVYTVVEEAIPSSIHQVASKNNWLLYIVLAVELINLFLRIV